MVATRRAVQTRSIDVRRRILDAAVQVLVREGYAGTSTLRIQQEAGVSRGRLLHHYPSRDALLIAASHQIASTRIAEFVAEQTWPADPGERVEAAVDALATSFDQSYFWAATELWIAARNHEQLRSQILPLERSLAIEIRNATASYFGPELSAHPEFPDLREIVFTSLRGMALTRSFDQRDAPYARHVARLKQFAKQVLLPQTPPGDG